METTGTVQVILEPQGGIGGNGKEWMCQGFVIETHDQYPKKQYVEIFGKERIEKILPQVGEDVTVSFDLESREYNGRWYTSARAWKVEKANAAAAAQPLAAQPMPPSAAPAATAEPLPPASDMMGDNSGLPF